MNNTKNNATISSAGADAHGKVSLVTGASGNLGRSVAKALAARGDRLVLVGDRADALASAFGADSDQQALITANLTDAASTQRAVDDALARFGRIDAVCHLVGGFSMGPAVHETSAADWQKLQALNVDSLRHIAAAAVPVLLRQGSGSIVTVGAFAAQRGLAQMGAYGAAKAAVQRLTEAMSAELRAQGINVNCVLPTILDTPENRAAMPTQDPALWVNTDDLAQVIAFLTSPAARAVHGAALPVTGLS